MPLEDLLAFYGYESTIPVIASSSADSSPSELADELPDMTLDKVSWKHFPLLQCKVWKARVLWNATLISM